MIEVADVFRRFAADYLSAHGVSMPPSHRRAIEDILDCRTAALGGQVWRCEACNTEVFSYHSCGNRSCPKCHTAQTREWLDRRQSDLRDAGALCGRSATAISTSSCAPPPLPPIHLQALSSSLANLVEPLALVRIGGNR